MNRKEVEHLLYINDVNSESSIFNVDNCFADYDWNTK